METYSRIGLLRSYRNLQSYWTTTELLKRTVVYTQSIVHITSSNIVIQLHLTGRRPSPGRHHLLHPFRVENSNHNHHLLLTEQDNHHALAVVTQFEKE